MDRLQLSNQHDVAEMIRGATGDSRLADVVVRRVATAAADGVISRSELERVLQRRCRGAAARHDRQAGRSTS